MKNVWKRIVTILVGGIAFFGISFSLFGGISLISISVFPHANESSYTPLSTPRQNTSIQSLGTPSSKWTTVHEGGGWTRHVVSGNIERHYHHNPLGILTGIVDNTLNSNGEVSSARFYCPDAQYRYTLENIFENGMFSGHFRIIWPSGLITYGIH